MALEYKDEYFLSAKELPNYKKITGEKANEILTNLGYKYIHVDVNGNVHALSSRNQMINGYKVYVRKVPVL